MMRMEGLEPSRGYPRQILSLVRLPFRHIRLLFEWHFQTEINNITVITNFQLFFFTIRNFLSHAFIYPKELHFK